MPPVTTSPVVLVVDDEPCVLNAVCGILAHFGFAVLRAATPDEALRLAATVRQPIDLLLSDVVMPHLSGPALAERFATVHPEAQCLFMAGFPNHPEVVSTIAERGLPFLPKPFLPKELISKVRQVLNGRTMACGAGV